MPRNDYTRNKVLSITGSSIISLTRTADTTAYTAGDVIGNATTSIWTFPFTNMIKGSQFQIVSATLKIANTSVPSGMSSFTLNLYNATPTNIADNAAYSLASADASKYLGYLDMALPVDKGDILFSQNSYANFARSFATASNSLYGFLATNGAFTPTSACIKTIDLEIVGM
jgi:hypothetical protein